MRNNKDECRYVIYFGKNEITSIRVEDTKGHDIAEVTKEYLGATTIGAFCDKSEIAIITKIASENYQNDYDNVWINFYPTDTVIRKESILCGCRLDNKTGKRTNTTHDNVVLHGLTINEISTILEHSFVNYRFMSKIDWFCTHHGIKHRA